MRVSKIRSDKKKRVNVKSFRVFFPKIPIFYEGIMFEKRTFRAINLGLDWGIVQGFIDSPPQVPCEAGEVSDIFISILSPVSLTSHGCHTASLSPECRPVTSPKCRILTFGEFY